VERGESRENNQYIGLSACISLVRRISYIYVYYRISPIPNTPLLLLHIIKRLQVYYQPVYYM
jgi:hypothetical protein